ncbi:MAG: hypothetical protein KIT14_14070 [bacterium]|nr:hypothetical protein [bacterium]
MKWTSWVTAIALSLVVGLVVWSSLHVGSVRCEICIVFEGRQACRAVDGASAGEARQSAINNTCAFLASGVTQTMACERTPPSKDECSS